VGVLLRDQPDGGSSWVVGDKVVPGARQDPARSTGRAQEQGPRLNKAEVPPEQLFQQGPYEGQFSRYDALGIPTHGADGEEISKSLRKKLERKAAKHRTEYLGVGRT
jgi:hypothetical protein